MIKTSDRRFRFDERITRRSTLEILGVAPMAQCPIAFATALLASDSSGLHAFKFQRVVTKDRNARTTPDSSARGKLR